MLYGINGNVHALGGPIVARHCMMAGWCFMILTSMYMHLVDRKRPDIICWLIGAYGINGNVNVVGGPIVARHCMLADWCFMVLTAM